MQEHKDISSIVQQAAQWLSSYSDAGGPSLLVFSTGGDFPSYIEPMLREPKPATGQTFGSEYFSSLKECVACNPSIHDGAALFVRECPSSLYTMREWSCRLFPPILATTRVANRGSAFNSGLAISVFEEIDAVLHFSDKSTWVFQSGRASQIGAP